MNHIHQVDKLRFRSFAFYQSPFADLHTGVTYLMRRVQYELTILTQAL
jgi:hypothetical protein